MLVNLQPSEVSGTAVRLRPFSPPIKILVVDSITSFLPSALAFVSAFDLFAPRWFTSLRSTLGRSGRPLPWPYLLLSNFSALLWICNIAGCCSDTAGNCYYTPSTWKYQGTVFSMVGVAALNEPEGSETAEGNVDSASREHDGSRRWCICKQ